MMGPLAAALFAITGLWAFVVIVESLSRYADKAIAALLMSPPPRPHVEEPRGHREWSIPLAERKAR